MTSEKLCKMMVHKMPDSLRWKLRALSVKLRKSMSQIIIDLVADYVEAERRKEQE